MCPSYWQKKKKIYNWPVFSQWLVKGSSTVQASRSRCSCNHVAPNRCADHVTGGPLIDKQSFRHARINYPFFPGPGARTMQASLQAFANSVQRTSTQLKPAPTNTEEIETCSRKESERKEERRMRRYDIQPSRSHTFINGVWLWQEQKTQFSPVSALDVLVRDPTRVHCNTVHVPGRHWLVPNSRQTSRW
jgi:hypothetical protein